MSMEKFNSRLKSLQLLTVSKNQYRCILKPCILYTKLKLIHLALRNARVCQNNIFNDKFQECLHYLVFFSCKIRKLSIYIRTEMYHLLDLSLSGC